jgi:hypothetical protein
MAQSHWIKRAISCVVSTGLGRGLLFRPINRWGKLLNTRLNEDAGQGALDAARAAFGEKRRAP